MAVFISASDESAGKNRRDQFVFAGLVASVRDWSEIFSPAWEGLVLKGPPSIPNLHMTDMRSPKWREEHFLSDEDADERVERAVKAIAAAEFLYPVGLTVSGADICDAFADVQIKSPNRARTKFEPDYLCFLGYAMVALDYVSREHPECEKLDFIVERNGKITDYIGDFHSTIGKHIAVLGRHDLARLVGELLPVGKDRVPVQAADVLCWHTARFRSRGKMDSKDFLRYQLLRRKQGNLQHLCKSTVQELSDLLHSKNHEEQL